MTILGAIFAATGFTLIALAMRRHAMLVPTFLGALQRLMRAAGGLLLILSLVPCLAAWPTKIAWVAWFGVQTIGALVAALLISGWSAAKEKRPHR